MLQSNNGIGGTIFPADLFVFSGDFAKCYLTHRHFLLPPTFYSAVHNFRASALRLHSTLNSVLVNLAHPLGCCRLTVLLHTTGCLTRSCCFQFPGSLRLWQYRHRFHILHKPERSFLYGFRSDSSGRFCAQPR